MENKWLFLSKWFVSCCYLFIVYPLQTYLLNRDYWFLLPISLLSLVLAILASRRFYRFDPRRFFFRFINSAISYGLFLALIFWSTAQGAYLWVIWLNLAISASSLVLYLIFFGSREKRRGLELW